MLIGHISDLHYSQKHLQEVDRCTAFAVDAIIREKCDVVVLSGDSTDHRLDLHSPAVSALLHQVRRLAEHCPVLILHGTASHEPPGTLEAFKTMGGRYPIYVADRIKQAALVGSEWVESADWCFDSIPIGARALFSVLPSVNKGAVAAIHGIEGAAEAVGEYVYQLLKGWASLNLDARQIGIPTIGVSHGTVTGCVTEHGVPMAGLDHEFTTGILFSAECSAFLLGHIHQMQQWDNGTGRVIAYPGSVGRLHFGEVNPKGFLIWDIQTDRALPRFIETPAKKLLQIDFPGAPDIAELWQHAEAGVKGCHVRIRYSIDEEHRHSVDKDYIRSIFREAEEVKIEGRINPIQRTRSEGITRMSLDDKLIKWCEVTGTDATPLRGRLTLLTHIDPETVVAEILGENKKEKAA